MAPGASAGLATVGGIGAGSSGGHTVGGVAGTTSRNVGSNGGNVGSNGGNVGTNGGNTGSAGGNVGTTGRNIGSNSGRNIGTIGGNIGGLTTGAAATGTGTGGGSCTEFDSCDPAVGCGCGLVCVFEPLKGGDACEHSCKKTSDCLDAATVCDGKTCVVDLCGIGIGGAPNGTLDGTCNSAGTDDGTCIPITLSDGGAAFGVCYQGGTSKGPNCNQSAARNEPAVLCPAGSVCFTSGNGVGPKCYLLCDPSPGMGGDAKCQSQGYNQCSEVEGELGWCL